MGYTNLVMGLTAVLACLDVPAVSPAALSSLWRPGRAAVSPAALSSLWRPGRATVSPAALSSLWRPVRATVSPAALSSLSRPVRATVPRRPAPVVLELRRLPLWPAGAAVLSPPLEQPFVLARRSRVPAVLPWRRPAARRRTPFDWPDSAAVHGKDVHWPALRQDGFMLHHAEVNRGHHHQLDFGAQPAESGLIDLMML